MMRLGYDSLGRIKVMPESDSMMKAALNDGIDTPRLNGNVTPPWLSSQNATPPETPKAKRARKVKPRASSEVVAAYARIEQDALDTLRPPPSLVPIEAAPRKSTQVVRADALTLIALALAVVSLGVSLAAIIR